MYEGQKSGQSQHIDYAGGIGRTNTWPPQDVPPDAKVVQNFQDKSRAKYMEELPETCPRRVEQCGKWRRGSESPGGPGSTRKITFTVSSSMSMRLTRVQISS